MMVETGACRGGRRLGTGNKRGGGRGRRVRHNEGRIVRKRDEEEFVAVAA